MKLKRCRMVGTSAGPPTSRPKSPSSTDGFGRQTEFANRDRSDVCVDPSLAFARLVRERSGFAQEGSFRCRIGRHVADIGASVLALGSAST